MRRHPAGGHQPPLLARATERFADDQTPRERIAAIDDEVLYKVNAQRWRGAVWIVQAKYSFDLGYGRISLAGMPYSVASSLPAR